VEDNHVSGGETREERRETEDVDQFTTGGDQAAID